MMTPADDERLARYLAGEATPAEAAALERAAASDPVFARVLAETRTAWEHAGAAPSAASDIDADAAWRRFSARVEPAAGVLPLRPARAPRAARWFQLPALRAAAVAALLVAGALLVWRVAAPGVHVLATGVGESAAHTLADGSVVRLGPGSSVAIRRGYASRHRTLDLDGTAHFRVAGAGTGAAPFLVRAGDARIHDIGTAFMVRAPGPGAAVEVVVTEGAVWLGGTDAGAAEPEGVLLQAGESARLEAGSRAPHRLPAMDTTTALAWTRGELRFDAAPLAEVALELRRWYGLEVLLADPSLAERRITASFSGESAADVLSAIARTVGAAWSRDGDRVTFEAARE
jgi:transmembrane sensor